jgi:hypothetical protein
MNLAEFKRKLVVGTKLKSQFLSNNARVTADIVDRTIVHVQSNSFAMTSVRNDSTIEQAMKNPHKYASWLQYPKAKQISVDEEGWIVISDEKTNVPFVRYKFD